MKKAKLLKQCRVLLINFTFIMLFTIVSGESVYAASSSYSPYAKIEYGYTSGVTCGTIRYISQKTSSGNFHSQYWPSSSFGGYASPGTECGTASISMALSYVGINKTPSVILNANNGYTYFSGWGATTSNPAVATGMSNYINGKGKYSPVIIHFPRGTYSASGHYVILIGKVSNTSYEVLDPAKDSTWILSTSSSLYMAIDETYQYYNSSASISSSIVVPRGTQTIPDGTYHIESKLNLQYGLDVKGGSNASGVNVQLYKNTTDKKQVFKVTYLGNGYYSLISTIGNKCLDVSGGGTQAGTNVQVWNSNNTASQQWVIRDAGDGYVYIISKANGLFLDVSNGKVANGTNIHMWSSNGTDAQKWKLVSISTGTKTIENGHYHIISRLNSKYGLDVNQAGKTSGTNLQIFQNTKDYLQIFNVQSLGNGLYQITSDISDLSLDVRSGGNVKGTNLQLYKKNGTWAQKWIIKSAGNGYYYIINQGTNLAVDVSGGTVQNKQNVQLWIPNGTNAQKWKFVKVSAPKKVSISKVSSPSKKIIYSKWNKLSDADGYEIQISLKSKFTSILYKGKITGISYYYKKAIKGKRYYVRIRGYRRIGTKYLYGSWSNIKSVKSK